MGSTTGYGYTVASINGRLRQVAPYLWEKVHGPLPEGKVLRRCRAYRPCVNPDHCSPTTFGELAAERRTDTCLRGHPYDEANTRVDKRGSRYCRACDRERGIRRRKKENPA